MTINSITLQNVIPDVFTPEQVEGSQVWRSSLSFTRPEAYLIAAESGGGKSSLCSFIYGSRSDYRGRILFDDVDVRGFSLEHWCALRREAIALLPQQLMVFPQLSAMENLMLKNRLTDRYSASELTAMLDRLGISAKADVKVGCLSVGQQQRVAIIRALCQPFSFILLDEPVSHLDERNNREVASLVVQAAQSQQAAIIATSVGNPLLLDNFTELSL